MYGYIKDLWNNYEVGFYAPNGTWNVDKTYTNPDDAAKRVNYMNGGDGQAFSNKASEIPNRPKE